MFQALDAPVPVFAHLPLLVDAAGGGLSKRTGSLSIADLRERGIEAVAIPALLARLGTSDPVEPVVSLDALVAPVDFGKVGRAAARFSEEELAHLNARTLHNLPYDPVSSRLRNLDADLGEPFWLAVRGNLATLAEAQSWVAVVRGPIQPVIEDAAFLAEAAGKLPSKPWDEATWKNWTQGPRALPSATPGAHRPGEGTGDGEAASPDRPDTGHGTTSRPAGLESLVTGAQLHGKNPSYRLSPCRSSFFPARAPRDVSRPEAQRALLAFVHI